MKPGDLLNKALSAGPVRKLAVPTTTKAVDLSLKHASPKARTEVLAQLDRQKEQLEAIRKRLEVLEGCDWLAKGDTLRLPRA
jgi:hypothetical protein